MLTELKMWFGRSRAPTLVLPPFSISTKVRSVQGWNTAVTFGRGLPSLLSPVWTKSSLTSHCGRLFFNFATSEVETDSGRHGLSVWGTSWIAVCIYSSMGQSHLEGRCVYGVGCCQCSTLSVKLQLMKKIQTKNSYLNAFIYESNWKHSTTATSSNNPFIWWKLL